MFKRIIQIIIFLQEREVKIAHSALHLFHLVFCHDCRLEFLCFAFYKSCVFSQLDFLINF